MSTNRVDSTAPFPQATQAGQAKARRKQDQANTASGQLVVVAARWILVLAGLFLTLWNPDPLPSLRFQVGILLLLAVTNFFLHAQLLMRRPTLQPVMVAASVFDIITITLLIATQGGFASNIYIFYFPALLAISVAFPLAVTALYGSSIIGFYTLISLVSGMSMAEDVQILVVRLLMLVAVAFCGVLYQHVEAGRRQAAMWARQGLTFTAKQEAAEDVFFGQIVLIWARWFVILAGGIFALWSANSVSQLSIAILLIVTMMAVNFFVHGRYLMEQPVNQILLITLSFADLAAITLLLLAWPGQIGLHSFLFVLYYPILLAFAFVFEPDFATIYTLCALIAYTFACLFADPTFARSSSDVELLVMRLITLAAMGGLGTYYWRIQRNRRRVFGNP